ncbi:hypothetical protein [Caloranaerobacter sp. DY30410]|uniref:hypothetical protein n=1 Tax=Caloranaerobacter sp. DY30410 TaxID=3238305 RepID=UPI003D0884C7
MARALSIIITIIIIASSFIYIDKKSSSRTNNETSRTKIEKVEQTLIQQDKKLDDNKEYNDKNIDKNIDKNSEVEDLDMENEEKTSDESSINILDKKYQDKTDKDEYNEVIKEDNQEITEQDNQETDIEIDEENIYIEDINNNDKADYTQVEDQIIDEEQISENSYYEEIYSDENIKYIRTDFQNDVYVDVVFLNLFLDNENLKENLVFDVFLNTHTYNISENNLEQKIVLKNDKGLEVSENIEWLPVGIPEGHHVFGKLIVPSKVNGQSLIDNNTEYLKIIMTDVAGAEERVFIWTKEEVNFKSLVK